jgi:signal transduction histidine kinase
LAGQIAAAFQTAASYERALEVDRLKSEFLANMSHELRTPMNSILGYTEVLLMGIDGELTKDMEEDVQAIFENGQQLLRLINDILDLTKIEAGRMTLTMEIVDVAPLLDDSKVNNLGLLHKRKTPVEILIEADEDLPFITADRVRIGQVLNNLVSNAVKFTDEGTITLRAYQVDEERICIEVEDTGMGIAKEDQGKLFERFRQVDGSSTRKAEGTGLGLAITRHLVAMHGGELALTSELGKGSKFSIYLPIEQPADTTEI